MSKTYTPDDGDALAMLKEVVAAGRAWRESDDRYIDHMVDCGCDKTGGCPAGDRLFLLVDAAEDGMTAVIDQAARKLGQPPILPADSEE